MQVQGLGRGWSWPDEDDKCRAVIFDWSKDLDVVYPHCRKFDTAVQAGGNMGVWPLLLAKKFKLVHTFEPDPRCLPHLHENLRGLSNVRIHEHGLWNAPDVCCIKNMAHEQRNLGAQYVVLGGDGQIPLDTIDSLLLDSCDLIYLDIEGAELPALQGARETIEKFRPVIAVEDKTLSRRFGYEKGDIEKWLAADYGYRVVARPHRDVVLAC
jgi:FkbM family methyltransferase